MSQSYHGHEVMQLMVTSGETHTEETYTAALAAKFGKDATFFSCSADGMSPKDLLTFFRDRGKVVDVEGGFRFGACGHGHGHGDGDGHYGGHSGGGGCHH